MIVVDYFCNKQRGNNTEPYYNGSFFFDTCFHDTGPVLLPFIYAVGICIPYLLYIVKNKKPIAHFFRRRRGHGPIQPMKLILSLCFLGIHIAETIFALKAIFSEGAIVGHVVFRLCISLVVGAFILSLTLMEMKRDIAISTCLFLMWLLLLGVNTVRLAVAVVESWHLDDASDVAFGCTCVALAIVSLQTVIYGFIGPKTGNKPLEPTKEELDAMRESAAIDSPMTPAEEDMKRFEDVNNPPSPEGNTSVMSMLTYWWMTTFVIKGWRHPLQPGDIYQLPYSDRTRNLSNRFNEAWKNVFNQKPTQPASKAVPVMFEQAAPNKEPSVNAAKEDEAGEKLLGGTSFQHKTADQPAGKPAGLVIKTLLRAFGSVYLFGGLIKLAQDASLMSGPVLMMLLTSYIKDYEHRPVWQGYAIAVGLLFVGVLQAAFLQRFFYFMAVSSLRFRAALSSAIFEKSLRLSNAARQQLSSGETVNLIATDTANLLQITGFLHFIWAIPLQVTAVIWLLWLNLGIATLAGLGVTIVTMLVSGVVARIGKKFLFAKLKKKDERIKLINEVLTNIKTVKAYAWEEAVQAKIEQARDEELSFLKKSIVLNVIAGTIWFAAPIGVALATFATYIYMDPDANLSPGQAFVSIVLFNLLRFSLIVLPQAVSNFIQFLVSMKRIGTYLLLDELDPSAADVQPDPQSSSAALRMKNASFAWRRGELLSNGGKNDGLTDINLTIKRGQLVGVIGDTGSGKSSLLSAILGEMVKTNGSVTVFGKVAYLPQTPWILNTTVKRNILFSADGDKSRKSSYNEFYYEVVDACALKQDFDTLPGGEEAEIGEKGANLSGGQKQRIALARAVYSKADIYLLDDTLSAVDSYTGQHLFDRVIGPSGLLAGSATRPAATRIWVTHKLNYLSKCDHIIFVSNGRVVAQGSYSHLMAASPQFSDLAKQNITNGESGGNGVMKADDAVITKKTADVRAKRKSSLLAVQKQHFDRLTEDEKIEEGAVRLAVYGSWVKAAGIALIIIYLLCSETFHCFGIAGQSWLATWTAHNLAVTNATEALSEKSYYFAIYCGLTSLQAVFMFLSTVFLASASLRASRVLHARLLGNIIRTTLQFFESTPASRILTRFAKDIDTVDTVLIEFVTKFVASVCYILATYIVVAIKLPIFLLIGVPLLGFAVFLQRMFACSMRQLKRIELATQSPILTHFSETIAGASSIRAYGRQKQFVKKFGKLLDMNHAAYYASQMTSGWLLVRTEFVGVSIIFVASMIGVVQRETLDPSAVGLALGYAMSVGFTLFWAMQHASALESNIVSVERIDEYNATPKDQQWFVPEFDNSSDMTNWPNEGEVVFESVVFRYRDGLDPALRNLSFAIRPREKIGVVGRTGAGKTSLAVVLLRLNDLTAGKILIDGVDISKIGLHTLRNAITPIPQDPVLFTGTLRFNLDPFGKHSDAALKRCLELVHLHYLVDGTPDGLDMTIAEGGENFSAGQRQLICLARALLRRPADGANGTHILIMDEATASVDATTDRLITEMIRREFKDFTVITIAHRLDTVLAYDRILVMANGQVVEFDTPSYLMNDKNSYFHSLAKSSGLIKQ